MFSLIAVLLWQSLFSPVEAVKGRNIHHLEPGFRKLFMEDSWPEPSRLLVLDLADLSVKDLTSKLAGGLDQDSLHLKFDELAQVLWARDKKGDYTSYDS